MFKAVLTNFGNPVLSKKGEDKFRTFEEAVEACKEKGFECTISDALGPFASWSPIGGLRRL